VPPPECSESQAGQGQAAERPALRPALDGRSDGQGGGNLPGDELTVADAEP
jgi:hypothetical protein